MDHHEFERLLKDVKATLTGDANDLLSLLKPVESFTVDQNMSLVDIIIDGQDRERTIALFSDDIDGDSGISHLARLVVGKLIRSSVDEMLTLLKDVEDKKRALYVGFVTDVIDPIPVTELLEGSSVDSVCKLLEILLAYPDERTKSKMIEFVVTENRSLQVAAVRLLGTFGTAFAVEVLIDSIDADEALGILIVNQLSKSKQHEAISGLISLLSSDNVKIRSFVEKKIEQVGTSVIGDLNTIVESPQSSNNLLVSVLGVLSKLHDPSSLKSVKRLVNYFHESPNVRAAAYMALSAINLQSGAPLLVDALRDPVDDVAFVAARSLEKGCNTFIQEGVRNVINSNVYPVDRLVEIFLFAGSDTILKSLLDMEEVVASVNTLCKHAGMELYRKKYASVLHKDSEADERSLSGRGLVWAIDDAPSVLNMYERFCIKNGLPMKSYDNALIALELIPEVKPDLIFVDLNMPGMDGISFTKEVRKHFSKEELPIVLVTTQEGVTQDVNLAKDDFWEIIYKPFNEEALRGVQESIFSSLAK